MINAKHMPSCTHAASLRLNWRLESNRNARGGELTHPELRMRSNRCAHQLRFVVEQWADALPVESPYSSLLQKTIGLAADDDAEELNLNLYLANNRIHRCYYA